MNTVEDALLEHIKAGGAVVEMWNTGYGAETRYVDVQVKHVTPKGRIVSTEGVQYRSTGQKIGDRGAWSQVAYLVALTDEVKTARTRQTNEAIVRNLNVKKLSNEQLAAIVAVVNGKKAE